MSPTETAALLRKSRFGPCCGDPECPEERLNAALEAAAAAIEAAGALRAVLHGLAHGGGRVRVAEGPFVFNAPDFTDTEREAARRLLAVIGGES